MQGMEDGAESRGRKPTTSKCTFESFPEHWPHSMRRNQLFEAFTQQQKRDIKHWVEMQEADPLVNTIRNKEWAAYFGCCGKTWYRLLSDHFLEKTEDGRNKKRRYSSRWRESDPIKDEAPDLRGDQAPMNAES